MVAVFFQIENPHDQHFNFIPRHLDNSIPHDGGSRVDSQYDSFFFHLVDQLKNCWEETYFASEYGQTNVREDRAEVFKYMIGRAYKPTGWFDNTPLKAKASVIRQQLIDYFPSVKPGVTYYWDNIIN